MLLEVKFEICVVLSLYLFSNFLFHFLKFTDPFDCTGSLCNLAWLIQGNRKLLGNKVIATCANATSFKELNRVGFKSCTSL